MVRVGPLGSVRHCYRHRPSHGSHTGMQAQRCIKSEWDPAAPWCGCAAIATAAAAATTCATRIAVTLAVQGTDSSARRCPTVRCVAQHEGFCATSFSAASLRAASSSLAELSVACCGCACRSALAFAFAISLALAQASHTTTDEPPRAADTTTTVSCRTPARRVHNGRRCRGTGTPPPASHVSHA